MQGTTQPPPAVSNGLNGHSGALDLQPPSKKRKLNEHVSAPAVPVLHAQQQQQQSLVPPSSMPSGPPPKELLDANPYGVVHMAGNVWCDACNRWFDLHCFDSHLQGKKHKKNIEAFSFRKVLKHWQNIRTKVVDDFTRYSMHTSRTACPRSDDPYLCISVSVNES